ncbi:sunset domain-containing protein [Deinococcus sp. UYEF24]
MRMRTLAVLAAFGLSSALAAGYNLQAPLVPDPKLSPGDVLTSDPKIVCVSGYTKTVRNVPQSLKEQVYREYGITSRQSGEYEIDHLISLELGGSNSIRNLFPESYKTTPLNAHVKDKLENKLHDLACSGKITLAEAQQAIASNWTTAYVKYLGALPGGAQPVMVGKAVPLPPTTTVPAQPPAAPVTSTPVAPSNASGSFPPNPDGSCPAVAPIKGNAGSKGKIYHLPQGDGNYTRTHAEACFSSAQAAQAAGYRGIK